MGIQQARDISDALGGEVRKIDEETWIVVFERADGRLVVLSDSSVEEFFDDKSFEAGRCYACISLT